MTRERWEQILFAHVGDEVVQDMLNQYVLELESSNNRLLELVDALIGCGTRYHTMSGACPMFDSNAKDCCKAEEIARELGVEVSNA